MTPRSLRTRQGKRQLIEAVPEEEEDAVAQEEEVALEEGVVEEEVEVFERKENIIS